MTGETDSLLLEIMKRMQGDMADLKFVMRDLKVRMTMVEEHLGNSLIAISGVNARLDRLTDRVERIENRLEMTEAR